MAMGRRVAVTMMTIVTIVTMTVAHPILDNLAGPSDAAVILLVHRLNKLVEYPHIFLLLLLLLPKKMETALVSHGTAPLIIPGLKRDCNVSCDPLIAKSWGHFCFFTIL